MNTTAPLFSRLALAIGLVVLPGSVLAETGSSAESAPISTEVNIDGASTISADAFAIAAAGPAKGDAFAQPISAGAVAPDALQTAQPALMQDKSSDSGGLGLGGFTIPKIVFDETWASVGLGIGAVPSYAGSDDYIAFPLPVLAGRVAGIGISPNGPGFTLDLFSPESGANQGTRFFGGPTFRVRNDRAQQINDPVVELAGELDWAVEVGAQAGVSFSGVFNPVDTLSISAQARWDVAGAHDGMLIEPSMTYSRLFGPGIRFSTNLGLQFVDDSFADYYFSLSPGQSVASGLPVFTADGGLNNASSTTIINFDLDGNALNGGLNIYTVLGYSRMIGDGADTPFTSIRGDANQFIGGVGLGYTF